jgi:hypothetical protein
MDLIRTKSLHFTKFIVVGAALGLAVAHPAAATQDTKIYDGITQNMFDNCIKNNRGGGGWSEYSGGNTGSLVVFGDAMPGKWVADLTYTFDPPKLTYKATKVAFVVSWDKLWGGFDGTLQRCESSR